MDGQTKKGKTEKRGKKLKKYTIQRKNRLVLQKTAQGRFFGIKKNQPDFLFEI